MPTEGQAVVALSVAAAYVLSRARARKTPPAEQTLRPELITAALLVKASGPGLNGLSTVLEKLACTKHWPEDATEWLCARLRAYREPHVCDYSEKVLENLVMKCDEFEGIHMLKTPRSHVEVWNLRKSRADLPVFGTGQCHMQGLLHVARHLKAEGYSRVFWFNMREEPVVFLNGRACAPRDPNALNENVDYLLAIEGYELDAMERRLAADCIEASSSAGGLEVVVELSGANERQVWPLATHDRMAALSVRDTHAWLAQQEGVPVIKYVRVPIADETAPEEKDFDALTFELREVALAHAKATACADLFSAASSAASSQEDAISAASSQEDASGTALIFNCHMGRGRTTTGMVCCSILIEAARGWRPPQDASIELPSPTAEERDLERGEYTSILTLLQVVDSAARKRPGARSRFERHTPNEAPSSADTAATPQPQPLRRIQSNGRRSMRVDRESGDIRYASLGRLAKLLADECAQDCAHTQHLVGAIAKCIRSAEAAESDASQGPGKAAFWRHRALKYLERYAYVLLFAAYALLAADAHFDITFSEWMRRNWQFKRAINNLTVESFAMRNEKGGRSVAM